ncbi:hypothetical protein FACS189472_18310 [Alphaproteobacteria bacterium]|nr:hypothetical protein FACS189472_18310 [Alphaproteobacteria bacterium]
MYKPPSNLRTLPSPDYTINAGGEGSGYIFSSDRSSSRALRNPEPTMSDPLPANTEVWTQSRSRTIEPTRATRVEEVADGINGEGEGGYIFSSNRSAPRVQNHSDEREVEDIRDLDAELREARVVRHPHHHLQIQN